MQTEENIQKRLEEVKAEQAVLETSIRDAYLYLNQGMYYKHAEILKMETRREVIRAIISELEIILRG